MTVETVTLHLPQEMLQRLQRMAEVTRQSVEDVAFQTIKGNLPPLIDDVPVELRARLADLQTLSDKALWDVVQETLPTTQWQRHEQLLIKNETGALTASERAELERLRAATDQFVLRRSFALALLKWRGYTISQQNTPAPR